MSMLLRLVRSQITKHKLPLLTPKDIRVWNTAARSDVSIEENKKMQRYEVQKPWVSYGFDDEDQKRDRQIMHVTLFVAISLCLIVGALIVGYAPDPLLKDWAQREAYLQLRYREENGLPLINPDLIDPSKFVLPTEEELRYTEVII